MRLFKGVFSLVLVVFLIAGCKKDPFFDPSSFELAFSTDTLFFDTVFTARGSATYNFKVYNNSRSTIKLSNVRLGKGDSSPFYLNIDGISGKSASGIEIAPRDSVFIFAQVTIDPLNANSPLVVTDSVIFEVFGKEQHVDLVAWGQDAHYFFPDQSTPGLPPYSIVAGLNQNVTWPNDKPYVIYGYAVIDSAGSLTIEEGARIHFHKNSGMWVYKGGSIKVNGTKDNPVTFQGDRLEPEYKEEPGQWDRILINDGSLNNEINYAVIKNAFIGLQVEVLPPTIIPSHLKVNNTIIKNMSSAGMLTRFYDQITGYNNLIYNCGQYAMAFTLGGKYNFTHTTIANFWNIQTRKTPSLFLNNYNEIQTLPLDFTMTNSIIYGDQENELAVDIVGAADYRFENCLIKSSQDLSDVTHYLQILKNDDPLFEDRTKQNYKLSSGSTAIDAGNPVYTTGIQFDLAGSSRVVGVPDLGAYERQ